ncbi:hypothetical protein BDD12DRAFT_554363 [Trichophaea hybrida]|nr:hypothetical protein BDD12DRAFT_554363 [Trichophaea hybrida]
MIHRAISDKVKFGTSFKYTWMLSLALLGRKDGDIEAIKDSYKRMFGDTLLPFLKEALKKETLLANLFMNALENHSFPGLSEVPEANKKALEDEINKEADDLFTATVGNVEGNKFAWVFTTSSQERLKDIMAAFNTRHKQSLASVVEKKLKKTEAFRDELLYILRGVEDRPKRDAELLENTMKGIGTRDTQLTFRLITASWDKEHLTKVKDAYKRRFPTRGSLLLRIEGDTSGEHQKFLKALVISDAKK